MSDSKEEKKVVADEDDMLEEDTSQQPLMVIAKWVFEYGTPDEVVSPAEKKEIKSKIMEEIKDKNMTAFYKHLCTTFNWTVDDTLVSSMTEANEKELKELEEKIVEAEKNAGKTEVTEATLERSNFFARIGEKDKAMEGYEKTMEITVGPGARIDLEFAMIRIGLCWNDKSIMKTHIEKAKALVEKGGDWERRNLLGIYDATYLLIMRQFKDAAAKLIDAIATFTCYDLYDYNTFVLYAVLSSMITLDRNSLRDKVVKAPEVLSCIREIAHLPDLLFSLEKCDYSQFFRALANIAKSIRRDIYLSAHAGYYIREVRIVAYSQFLASYRSVTLESMADAFGVSTPFLDAELSRFIAAGRLNCKIDKVGGIVESNRPDIRNTEFDAIISEGDALLNRLQKLTKVIQA